VATLRCQVADVLLHRTRECNASAK
jgi:hypothetical protein